jgi:hypothetical protein
VWLKYKGTKSLDLQHQGLSEGFFPYPQVASGSARPWPALRVLLHRNLVLRTHRPARYGLDAVGKDGGPCMAFLVGPSYHPAISDLVPPSPQEPALLENRRLRQQGEGRKVTPLACLKDWLVEMQEGRREQHE